MLSRVYPTATDSSLSNNGFDLKRFLENKIPVRAGFVDGLRVARLILAKPAPSTGVSSFVEIALVNPTKEKQSWVVCREPSMKQSAISLKVEQAKLSDDA
jgi:hypothetical protein